MACMPVGNKGPIKHYIYWIEISAPVVAIASLLILIISSIRNVVSHKLGQTQPSFG